MLDKDHRIQQIANRYTPPIEGEALAVLRARFTTKPGAVLSAARRLPTGKGTPYQRLEHGQIVCNTHRPALSRKHRLRLRRAQSA